MFHSYKHQINIFKYSIISYKSLHFLALADPFSKRYQTIEPIFTIDQTERNESECENMRKAQLS